MLPPSQTRYNVIVAGPVSWLRVYRSPFHFGREPFQDGLAVHECCFVMDQLTPMYGCDTILRHTYRVACWTQRVGSMMSFHVGYLRSVVYINHPQLPTTLPFCSNPKKKSCENILSSYTNPLTSISASTLPFKQAQWSAAPHTKPSRTIPLH